MKRSFALLLLAMGCGPKEATPTAAVQLATATLSQPTVLLPSDVEPFAGDWPALPALPGMVAGQELSELLRNRTVFQVEADSSALARLDAAGLARLRAELAADPRWRVTRWAGHPVAFRRVRQGDGWSIGFGGYAGAPGDQWRVALWLVPGGPWPDSVQANPATAARVRVDAWPASGAWAGSTGALLAIAGPVAAIEVHELATDLQLAHTAAALTELPQRIDETVRGLAPRHPIAPPPAGPDALWVEGLTASGALDVRAQVNPGMPGICWLRILGPDGAPWEERFVIQASQEDVGWSDQAAQRFEFQAWIPALQTPPPAGTLELYFQPAGGGAVRRLLTAPTRLPPPAPSN